MRTIVDAFRREGTPEDRPAVFDAWARRSIGDPGWTLLEAEFAVHATRRDPRLREQVAAGGRGWAEALRALIVQEADRRGVRLPLPAGEPADVLLGLGIGLGLRRAVDPAVSPAALTDMIRLIFNAGESAHGRPPPAGDAG